MELLSFLSHFKTLTVGVALGIEPTTSLQSSKLPTELLSCCRLRSIKAAEYNYSLLIHLYLLRHKHTILSEVVEGLGGGGQGFLSAIMSMTLLPSYMYFHAKQKKAQRKVPP